MNLENLQTLSKLKKYAFTTFFKKKYACSHSKKSCARIFFLSLERFWRFSKLILPFFKFLFPTSLCGVLVFDSVSRRLLRRLLLLPPSSNTNLTYNNFTHTNLTYNNFTHTNLTYNNFTYTNLTHTNLTHTQT